MTLADVIGLDARATRAVIGMVHLRALPGSPRWAGDMAALVRAALDDARALATGGADALLVENHGDVPFTARRVDAATVAGMAVAVGEIRRQVPLPVGVNVLKNDVRSALAVAAATGARFVRVNVHVGAVAADQGIIESEAHDTLRYRRLLGVDVAILADVQAKHGMPLAPVPLEQEARDCFRRGLADALVVSGAATGEPTSLADLRRVRAAVPEAPLLVGSGASPETVAELLSVADAVIVGTSIKREGRLANPVDVARVRRLVAAARGALG
jgi:membrane complex biogenesis BtpA family protein